MAGRAVELLATQDTSDEMDAYERLLRDAMNSDPALFAREDAVEAEWRIVAPILTGATAPHEYEAGTWGPVEADQLIDRFGGWHTPLPSPPR